MNSIKNKCQFCAHYGKHIDTCAICGILHTHHSIKRWQPHPDIVAFGQECKKEGFEAAREQRLNPDYDRFDPDDEPYCIDKYPTFTDYLNDKQ